MEEKKHFADVSKKVEEYDISKCRLSIRENDGCKTYYVAGCRIGLTNLCEDENCYYKQLQSAREENNDLKTYLKDVCLNAGLIDTDAQFKRCLVGGAFKESVPKRAADLKKQVEFWNNKFSDQNNIRIKDNIEISEAYEMPLFGYNKLKYATAPNVGLNISNEQRKKNVRNM